MKHCHPGAEDLVLHLATSLIVAQVEYLLCYAMAGTQVRFCMLLRDDPNQCQQLLHSDLDLSKTLDKIIVLRVAIIAYKIISKQQEQLPQDCARLGSSQQGSPGTSIQIFDGYIIKVVQLEQQPHVRQQADFLRQLYNATSTSTFLINAPEPAKLHRTTWSVKLSPHGQELQRPALYIKDLLILRRAINHVLRGLQDMHLAKAAHTDVRWANVVMTPASSFRLIDLETAVPVDCKWNERIHGPPRRCWSEIGQEVLLRGKYPARSDLKLVSRLMQLPGLPQLDPAGQQLAAALLTSINTAQEALAKPWFAGL